MTPHWEAMFVLAQTANRFNNMTRQFQRHGRQLDSKQLLFYLGAAVAVAILIGGAAFLYKWVSRRYANSPTGLLIELCQAHGLPWKQRLLLYQLARSRNLAQPAALFLDPELFDASGFTPKLKQRRSELEGVRDRIFGKRLDADR